MLLSWGRGEFATRGETHVRVGDRRRGSNVSREVVDAPETAWIVSSMDATGDDNELVDQHGPRPWEWVSYDPA